jgi:hypothetical protein
MLGLRQLGVVAHGRFTRRGFARAIEVAARGVDEDVIRATRSALQAAGALRPPRQGSGDDGDDGGDSGDDGGDSGDGGGDPGDARGDGGDHGDARGDSAGGRASSEPTATVSGR